MAKLEMKDVINAICPWSGDPVSEDALIRYRGAVVGFCNPGCRDKFQRAIGGFDAAIEALAGNASQPGAGLISGGLISTD